MLPKISLYLHHTHTGRVSPADPSPTTCSGASRSVSVNGTVGQRLLRRSVTSKPVQRWRSTYIRAVGDCSRRYRVGRPASVDGRRPGDRGVRLRAWHSKESRRVRRPYLFKRRRHRRPSATASHLHHHLPACPSASLLCDVCVGTVCRRVCVSSTFYQTGEIKRDKKYTHTPAHCAILP